MSSSGSQNRSSSSSQGSLPNTSALLRVPLSPRSSSDSISAATYRGLSSSSSSRSSGRAGPASKKIMFEIKDRVDGPTVYGVPRIAPPPPPQRTRGVRMVAHKRNSSSSSSSSWSGSRGRAGPASRRIMFRIRPNVGPTMHRVPRIAPPPPPRTRRVRMVAPKRNSSLERRRDAEWREFRRKLSRIFGVTFSSRSSSSSSSPSSVSRRRSPSRSRTPSPK